MIFSKIAIALISPIGSALVLGAVALVLPCFGKRRFGFWIGLSALLWLWFWSLPSVSMGLRGAIESEFPAPVLATLAPAPAVVVLGGVINPPSALQPKANLSAAADRLRFAAQLFHAGKAAIVVLSGGSDRTISLSSEAEAMRVFMHELGVPNVAMLLEEDSRTTQENARFTASLLRQQGVERVLLVTSALHMRRAMTLFEAEGVQVVAAATDHEARVISSWQQWIPDAAALEGSGRAMKEWVGLAAVRVFGR